MYQKRGTQDSTAFSVLVEAIVEIVIDILVLWSQICIFKYIFTLFCVTELYKGISLCYFTTLLKILLVQHTDLPCDPSYVGSQGRRTVSSCLAYTAEKSLGPKAEQIVKWKCIFSLASHSAARTEPLLQRLAVFLTQGCAALDAWSRVVVTDRRLSFC